MINKIQTIDLDKLIAHPDNPNRMSGVNFAKLVRNIKRTGRYEPLVVRPCPASMLDAGYSILAEGKNRESRIEEYFQIINGHHRCKALSELGYKRADAIVWDIDDEQTNILLATLNRLGGSDELGRKLALLKRLNKRMQPAELAKLLPQTKKQIERLNSMLDARYPMLDRSKSQGQNRQAGIFANPMVFFLNDMQQQIVEQALLLAEQPDRKMTRAESKAAALVVIAENFINQSRRNSGGSY